MSSTKNAESAAAQEFYNLIITRLTNEKGVHAETAIASAARMAGTFLLRFFNLPIETLEPGAPVFSDAVNQHGPALVELFDLVLQDMNIVITPSRFASVAGQADAPQLNVLTTQSLVEAEMNQIRHKYQLDYAQSARAATITTAILVQKCAQIVDPDVSYQVATYCFVEGSKTVPQKLPASGGQGEKKPWYKMW